jgi:type I restriction enzyme S subunit
MSEWKQARLSEVADIRFSNVDKRTVPGESRIQLCNYMDVYGNDYITADLPFMEASATPAEIERFKVDEGDVMLTKDSETPDDIGISAVATERIENLVCGYHLALIKPDKTRIDPIYLSKQLGSPPSVRYFGQRANGSTRYGLSSSAIANLEIPLAPFSHQRRIAEILGTVDAAIEATEALIAKQQQVKAGLMHDLFTRGLTPAGQLRPPRAEAPALYHETPLGWLPKEWTVARVKDFGVVKGGKRLPASTPFADGPTAFPYLRVTDLVDGWVDDSSLEYVDPLTERLISNYKIFRDDIYVTIAGTLGQFGRIPEHLSGAQLTENAARITEIDQSRVDLDYLSAVLRSDLMREQKFAAIGVGAGVPKLALYQIEKFCVPLPPKAEQLRIQSVLGAVTATLAAETARLAKLRDQKQGLMQALLTPPGAPA